MSGSVAGGTGNDPTDFGWYATAKAGILGYTRWCAKEFTQQARFNAIAPGGPIATPATSLSCNPPACSSGSTGTL